MTPQHVYMLFELIVFLFAISFHESAHAWMAMRRGDPTASMLGRVTLNPIKHIDPVGTILLPAIALLTGIPVLGWAKPTPVDPRNFRNPVLDDVLTSVAGPVSNFLLAFASVVLLILISATSTSGHQAVAGMLHGEPLMASDSLFTPLSVFLFALLQINVVLAIFNLIPVPPLDGSHVLRHILSGSVLMAYDRLGFFALLLLVYLGGGLIRKVITPVMGFFLDLVFRFT
jgi:Zn-dependent protease